MVCLWKCSTSPWRSLKQLKHPNLTHGTARLLSLSGIHGRRTAAWRCVSVRIIRSVHLLIAQLPVPDATLSSPRWQAVMKAFAQDSADNHNLFLFIFKSENKSQTRKKEEDKKKEKKKKKGQPKRGIEPITSAYQPIANAFPLGQNGQLCASVVWLCNVRSPQNRLRDGDTSLSYCYVMVCIPKTSVPHYSVTSTDQEVHGQRLYKSRVLIRLRQIVLHVGEFSWSLADYLEQDISRNNIAMLCGWSRSLQGSQQRGEMVSSFKGSVLLVPVWWFNARYNYVSDMNDC